MSVVIAVLAILVALIGLATGALAFAVWRLRRHNRVVPELRTNAKLSWLASPAAPARLHRRLRTAVRVARLADDGAGASRIIRELETHAAIVDDHLTVAAQLRAGRTAAMRALAVQAQGVEEVAGRLATAAVEARRAPALAGEAADPLVRIRERLGALEAARRDVVHLEQAAGLDHQAPAALGRWQAPEPR